MAEEMQKGKSMGSSEEISKLGVDAHQRYAQDRETLDATILDRAARSPSPAEVDVLKPSLLPEVDRLLDTTRAVVPVALFESPQGHPNHRGFTYQILPSIGPPEKQDALFNRIEAVPPEHQGEGDVLKRCFEKTRELDNIRAEISSKMGMYHRG